MTDPTKIIFGGVTLNKNDVRKMTTSKVQSDATSRYAPKDLKIFQVEFKNGIKVAYTESNGGYINSDAESWGDTSTNIYNVLGLELLGNPKQRDSIVIKGGSVRGIDVSGDGSDIVTVTDSQVSNRISSEFASKHLFTAGGVYTDKNDNTKLKNSWQKEHTFEGSEHDFSHGSNIIEGIHRIDKY